MIKHLHKVQTVWMAEKNINFKGPLRSGRMAQLHEGLFFALEEAGVQVQIPARLLAGFFFLFFSKSYFYFLACFRLFSFADPF